MRHITKIVLMTSLIFGVFSCELPDNVDPKKPSEVQAKTLFLNAQINLVDYVSSINQNLNNSRLLAQYAAQTTYTDESRYNFTDRKFNDALWEVLYHNVLFDLQEAELLLQENQDAYSEAAFNNRLAAINVLSVYTYQVLVDQFGDIPYTEALMGSENPTPAYDDAQTVYEDLIAMLTNAANTMDATADTWGSYDWFYSGDTDAWITLANSLKLRLAMRVADVTNGWSNGSPQQWAEDAVSAGVFASQDQSVIFDYPGTDPNVYTIWEEMIQGGRKDFVPANTVINLMNELEDPRREYFFDQHDPDSSYYIGGNYGDGNIWGNVSYFDETLKDPGYAFILIDYVEMEFFKAEAIERGFTVPGTAEEHYNNAIEASILDWGGSQAEVDTYLGQDNVAYTLAAGDWREKIGKQKYVALFDRGVEGWAEWRRLDYPEFNPPPDFVYSDIPIRQPYPFDENNFNLSNYDQAAEAIGGDDISTMLFWDKIESPFL